MKVHGQDSVSWCGVGNVESGEKLSRFRAM